MNIYLIMQNEEDYRQIISVPISAHPTREGAAAEAARLDLDAAWASNQPDYDGGGPITHHVYEIPFMSTPVDIAPSDMGSLSQASIGSALWNRHDVGWWPDYIPLFDRGPVSEILDARERLQNAGVESPIDGLVYCAAILKKPNCMLGVCIFGDTGYEFQIPVVSTPVDVAPQVLPSPPAEIYLPLSAAEFIALVREGKVRAETPDGDTSRVQLDRAGDGWARIGWAYEMYDDVADNYEPFYDYMNIDNLTHLNRCDDQFIVGNQTFTLTQEP